VIATLNTNSNTARFSRNDPLVAAHFEEENSILFGSDEDTNSQPPPPVTPATDAEYTRTALERCRLAITEFASTDAAKAGGWTHTHSEALYAVLETYGAPLLKPVRGPAVRRAEMTPEQRLKPPLPALFDIQLIDEKASPAADPLRHYAPEIHRALVEHVKQLEKDELISRTHSRYNHALASIIRLILQFS